MDEILSKRFSLEGFELLKYIKGRRRYLVGIIGAGLGYILSNNEAIAIISGFVFDGLLGLAEYYYYEYFNIKQ